MVEGKDGAIHALRVMHWHQLYPLHGHQVSFSLYSPDAPSYMIEYIIAGTINVVASAGARSVTFGTGVSNKI
jgi:hypothetical protein